MKKLLLVLSILISFPASASTIPEGAIVKTSSSPDVYIVKYNNGKQYKRLVLNPAVFKSYGHLKWENILTISQTEMDLFTTSNLVRIDGTNNVYELSPSGDTGLKQKLSSTDYGIDLNSVYTINSTDFNNYTDNGIKHVISRSEFQEMETGNNLKAKVAELLENYNSDLKVLDNKINKNRSDYKQLDVTYSDVKDYKKMTVTEYYARSKRISEYIYAQNVLDISYKDLESQRELVADKIKRLTIIFAEIEDYINKGISIPAADKIYLSDLGINSNINI
ncbi:MAG: hypothetical protein PHQ46_10710 [Negativicutes bacterium]|nr:hypothetical protein [Negativicutes bacterium]